MQKIKVLGTGVVRQVAAPERLGYRAFRAVKPLDRLA